MLLLCDPCGLARKKTREKMFFSCKVVWISSRRAAEFIESQSLLSNAEIFSQSRGVIASENESTQRDLRSWEKFTEMNQHRSRTISTYAPHRPKVSMLSPHKAEGLSAISASHTYQLCGSISSARENNSSLFTHHSSLFSLHSSFININP